MPEVLVTRPVTRGEENEEEKESTGETGSLAKFMHLIPVSWCGIVLHSWLSWKPFTLYVFLLHSIIFPNNFRLIFQLPYQSRYSIPSKKEKRHKQAMISLQGMAYEGLFVNKTHFLDFCRFVMIILFYYNKSTNLFVKVNEARLSSTVL